MKRQRFNISMMILLAAGLLAGCCHKDEPALRTQITVSTQVHSMLKRVSMIDTIDGNGGLRTKDLRIDAYFHGTNTAYLSNKKLHYTGTTPPWQFWDGSAQEHYYWPADGTVYDPSGANITYESLDFVGFCPYSEPAYVTAINRNTFTCNLGAYMTPSAQNGVSEFLMATMNEQTLKTQTDAGGSLPMELQHPFALIKFVIAAASGSHVWVDSIGIAGLYTVGTCTHDGTSMTWSSLSTPAAMTILLPPGDSLRVGTAHTATDPFMVIPNEYGEKTLSVRATWDDWSKVKDQTISADINMNWQPGYIYTYNLTVTPYALIVDTTKFTEQW